VLVDAGQLRSINIGWIELLAAALVPLLTLLLTDLWMTGRYQHCDAESYHYPFHIAQPIEKRSSTKKGRHWRPFHEN
jgi:hypothetical protein